jgi:hypothetical protein
MAVTTEAFESEELTLSALNELQTELAKVSRECELFLFCNLTFYPCQCSFPTTIIPSFPKEVGTDRSKRTCWTFSKHLFKNVKPAACMMELLWKPYKVG